MFLRLGKAGWYCVTKGNIFFCVLLSLFSSDLSLSVKLTSDKNFSENLFGYLLLKGWLHAYTFFVCWTKCLIEIKTFFPQKMLNKRH